MRKVADARGCAGLRGKHSDMHDIAALPLCVTPFKAGLSFHKALASILCDLVEGTTIRRCFSLCWWRERMPE